jgi:hypothetical protein
MTLASYRPESKESSAFPKSCPLQNRTIAAGIGSILKKASSQLAEPAATAGFSGTAGDLCVWLPKSDERKATCEKETIMKTKSLMLTLVVAGLLAPTTDLMAQGGNPPPWSLTLISSPVDVNTKERGGSFQDKWVWQNQTCAWRIVAHAALDRAKARKTGGNTSAASRCKLTISCADEVFATHRWARTSPG